MKFKLFLFSALITLGLCGCGHNIMSFSSGKYVNLGVDPNTNKFGIQYIDGEHISVIERDNAKLTVEFSDKAEKDGTSKIQKITYEIKDQSTGRAMLKNAD